MQDAHLLEFRRLPLPPARGDVAHANEALQARPAPRASPASQIRPPVQRHSDEESRLGRKVDGGPHDAAA